MVRTTRATGAIGWAVLPLALVAVVVVLGVRSRPRPPPAAAGAAIPSGAAVLVTVDLASARTGELASLLHAPAAQLGACAEDPLTRATTLAVGMPGEGDEFGVAVAGPFVASDLAACATQAIEARHGWVTTGSESGFAVVADVTARGAGVVAVRDGGPLLYGGARYVRAMIAAASGRAPSAMDDPRHRELRASVDVHATLVGSLVRAETDEGMRGLAISAAAGPRVEVRAFARCDRDETCAGLARLARAAKEELGPLGKLTWFGAAALRATIDPAGSTLRARVDLSPDEAREALGLVLGR